jgi:hypothetical protein
MIAKSADMLKSFLASDRQYSEKPDECVLIPLLLQGVLLLNAPLL